MTLLCCLKHEHPLKHSVIWVWKDKSVSFFQWLKVTHIKLSLVVCVNKKQALSLQQKTRISSILYLTMGGLGVREAENRCSSAALLVPTGGKERRTLTPYWAVSGWGGYMLEKYERPVGGSAGAQHKMWLSSGESASMVCHVTRNYGKNTCNIEIDF